MGKAGRIVCIATPVALTLATFICLVLVFLGNWNKNDGNLTSIHFFKADLSSFRSNVSALSGTDLDDQLLSALTMNVNSNLSDIYTIGLWNYCSGDKNSTGIDYCSDRKSSYWFNPVEVWGLQNTAAEVLIPDKLQDGLEIYKKVAHWMFIAYAIAFFATLAQLLVSVLAIFSRWGSFITTIVGSVATIFTLAATITSTALYGVLVGTFDSVFKGYNIRTSLGRKMMIITWLAVAFSIAAAVFWLLSTCCCSGKNGDHGRNKAVTEKAPPYAYERVNSPYSGNVSHQHQQQYGIAASSNAQGDKTQTAYEPFRHGNPV